MLHIISKSKSECFILELNVWKICNLATTIKQLILFFDLKTACFCL